MNLNGVSAPKLAELIKNNIEFEGKDVEIALFPPNILLFPVHNSIGDSVNTPNISLGAQNVHWEYGGSYTGETSVSMLEGLCKYVLVGHSERRTYFGENNAKVNRKIRRIIEYDLIPVICVGEQSSGGKPHLWEVELNAQVTSALYGCPPDKRYMFAYEPRMSIGTGDALPPSAVVERIELIKSKIEVLLGRCSSSSVPVLYGGSVSDTNAKGYLDEPMIDGLLIGGASLEFSQFCQIVRLANAAD